MMFVRFYRSTACYIESLNESFAWSSWTRTRLNTYKQEPILGTQGSEKMLQGSTLVGSLSKGPAP